MGQTVTRAQHTEQHSSISSRTKIPWFLSVLTSVEVPWHHRHTNSPVCPRKLGFCPSPSQTSAQHSQALAGKEKNPNKPEQISLKAWSPPGPWGTEQAGDTEPNTWITSTQALPLLPDVFLLTQTLSFGWSCLLTAIFRQHHNLMHYTHWKSNNLKKYFCFILYINNTFVPYSPLLLHLNVIIPTSSSNMTPSLWVSILWYQLKAAFKALTYNCIFIFFPILNWE